MNGRPRRLARSSRPGRRQHVEPDLAKVSRSLKSVGPNARLVEDDLEGAIRKLKAERDGEIEAAGPDLAQSLTERGLIDEHRIYLHPVEWNNSTSE